MDSLVTLFLNVLLVFYHLSAQHLGLALIGVTVFINLVMIPLNKQSVQMARKQRALQPAFDALKKQYGNDKKKVMEEQAKLMKEANINPLAGCLPIVVQMVVLIVLVQTFSKVFQSGVDIAAEFNRIAYHPSLLVNTPVDAHFLWYNLTERDVIPFAGWSLPGFLVLLSALTQFLSARMMLPFITSESKTADHTETKKDDISADLQKQMMYLFPLMYIWFGTHYPSGLALYFFISSLFALLRSYQTSDTVKPVLKGTS